MSLKDEMSLKDCTKLKQLIINNPDLPLLVFTKIDDDDELYGYVTVDVGCEISEVTLYSDVYGEYWVDKDGYKEVLQMEYENDKSLYGLSDDEFFRKIDEDVERAEWVKAIIIWS